MGTFVKLFRDSESIIPESRKEEFIERIEKIYQAGGMMEVEDVVLYRQRLTLIRKPKMDDDGMNFYYNYFEDDCRENAGFDRNNCYVWSNKVGWINYLFDEKFHIKNYDPWKLFETLHDKDKERLENISDFHFGEERYAFIGESLFDGLVISEEKELCDEYMGRFPVVSVSLKGVNGADYETARALMCSVIGREALRFETMFLNV